MGLSEFVHALNQLHLPASNRVNEMIIMSYEKIVKRFLQNICDSIICYSKEATKDRRLRC